MHSDNINQDIPSGVTKCTIVLVQVGSHPDRSCILDMGEDGRFSLLNLALMGHVRTGHLYLVTQCGADRATPKPLRECGMLGV